MDSIYSGARSVRICVQEPLRSPHLSDYKQLFHWLRRVDDGNVTPMEPWLYPTLVDLVSLRYFKRVWVIQEVALAKAAYLLVNDQELRLTTLVIDRLTYIFKQNQHEVPGIFRWYPGQRIEASIFTCLHAGMYSRATDPRDRVFAVLSLMEPHARSMIPVDYSLELEPVYTNAIIAMILTQRNLTILLHAGIGKALSSEFLHFPSDERICLNEQDLQRYILHNPDDGQDAAPDDAKLPSFFQKRRSVLFEGDSVGPWLSTIDVHIVSPMDYSREISRHESVSCVIQMPQPGRKDLLPHFRIRAHYIDFVDETHNHPDHPHDTQAPDSTWIYPYFDAGGKTNFDDLRNFLNMTSPRYPNHVTYLLGHNSEEKLFSGDYSVGFAPPGFEKGDEIFAIDGVRTPFILRRKEGIMDVPCYRIVSKCYVWSALELDCRNPGTRKGRWGRGVTRPISKQTRMIEIY
jgi:hypothetical protein